MRIGQSIVPTAILAAVIGCSAAQPRLDPLSPVQSRLHDDIAYLASPALMGRLTGTPGNDSAAAFIARRYHDLALIGAFNGKSCGRDRCENSVYQYFRLTPGSVSEVDWPIDDKTQNVAAVVPGTDSALRSEFIVIGAHFDHIGRSTVYARDGNSYRFVHPGADDNASGTAAVLELARRFAEHPARRSILLANFSAEELGLVGSQVFVENIPVPRDSIVAMVNLDMVGRLRDDMLIFFSGEDHDRFPALVDSIEHVSPILVFRHQWQSGRREVSDQATFAHLHVPVLGLFTDYHADYHRSSDIIERINFPGLEKVVDFTERFVRAVADGRDRPSPRD
jgi:hypothetical protein